MQAGRYLTGLVTALALAGGALAEEAPRVLLTFDVEEANDAWHLRGLGVDEPATYFFTGDYARAYPGLLRALAAGPNTIGSHSHYHDNLATLDPRHATLDIDMSRRAIEALTCRPVAWFRAPFLSLTPEVMEQIVAAGFRMDSSESTPWPANALLPELAISAFESTLLSDYNLLRGDAPGGEDIAPFLLRAFDAHAAENRPFIVLLHPRFIGQRPEALHQLIDHARAAGARFLTADAFHRETLAAPRGEALWLQTWEGLEPDRFALSLAGSPPRDIFVPYLPPRHGMNPPLLPDWLVALRSEGHRLHLVLDPLDLATLPGGSAAMALIHADGRRSLTRASPTKAATRQAVAILAADLAGRDEVDGVMLQNLAYDGIYTGFSAESRAAFARESGLADTSPGEVFNGNYQAWRDWRGRQLAEIAEIFRDALGEKRLGAVVAPALHLDFRHREVTGQEPALLGPLLDDLIFAPVTVEQARDPVFEARVRMATATQSGGVRLWLAPPPGFPSEPVIALRGGPGEARASDALARLLPLLRRPDFPAACLE